MIKKADIILLIVSLVLGIGFTALIYGLNDAGAKAIVKVNGDLYGTYPLSKDDTITINNDGHTNKIIIKDGSVSMGYSDCPNQECTEHSPINRTNEMITCLPNKVSVSIEGIEGGYDGITK